MFAGVYYFDEHILDNGSNSLGFANLYDLQEKESLRVFVLPLQGGSPIQRPRRSLSRTYVFFEGN
jgi:hypothetical protein